jgi:hypothetical protein
MMFFQAPQSAIQHNIGALDLAQNQQNAYEVSLPKRPVRTVDDSAIPDAGERTGFNWGTARAYANGGGGVSGASAAARTTGKEYETRERMATYFEAEF